MDFYHDSKQPRLDALCIRDMFLNREPNADRPSGMTMRARAAVAEWLQEPLVVDEQQEDGGRIHMYVESQSGEQERGE